MPARLKKRGRQKFKGFDGRDVLRQPGAGGQEEPAAAAEPATGAGLFDEASAISALPVNGRLRESLSLQGFEKLTTVQAKAMKPMLQARDVLIKSETGSGKTLAYMLPLADKILSWTSQHRIDRSFGMMALVLVPTRELAEQSYEVLRKLLQKCPFIVPGCIKGGEQRKKEKARLRSGVHWLVATVGRLVDHLRSTESFSCDKLRYLVLDEADRLLDMGFEKDISAIKEQLARRKAPLEQSVLVSATLGEGIRRLSHFMLDNPVVVGRELRGDDDAEAAAASADAPGNESGDASLSVPANLRQHYIVMPCKMRLVLLLTFLRWKLDELSAQTAHPNGNKIVVFVSSSDAVEFLYRLTSAVRVAAGKGEVSAERKAEQEAERMERRRERNRIRGLRKKKQQRANAHLDMDDEDGFQNFSDDDAAIRTFDTNDSDEESAGGDAAGPGQRQVPFIRSNMFKLHGNMTQIDRTSVYNAMRRTTEPGVLFATDVAARGLDLPGVRWVVQYDPAVDEKGYTHRVGRTARAGREGDAVVFLLPHEERYVQSLTSDYGLRISRMSMELALYQLATRIGNPHLLESASALQASCESATARDKELRRLSAVAYQAFLRAYAAYPRHLRDVFNVKQLHLGHVAKAFAVVKNPSRLSELAKGPSQATGDAHEPAVVRKRRMQERDEDHVKRPRLEDVKKAFRRPQATSKRGMFSEFDTGMDDVPVDPAPRPSGKHRPCIRKALPAGKKKRKKKA
eukprot:TRINITY_DN39238_c0_g1_i1.p1 TRINITY_DN39238_c0_g1~~TRINITY_DN39238_c0_g1_i1.p1  ORF type:complete len:742 (+),score=239.86 TRINITY_DN39238_c0_g1_i1:76-2301(+)